MSACQDKDYDIAAPAIATVDAAQIAGNLTGYDYTWTWNNPANLDMEISLYENGTFSGKNVVEGNSYTHTNLDANVEYTYVFKFTDGSNVSAGAILCIGNGGCEFSMKNADGTPDKSAHSKNNPYRNNVLTLAINSLEYLKTR